MDIRSTLHSVNYNAGWEDCLKECNEQDAEAVKKWVASLIPDDKPIDCINKMKKILGEALV